MTETTPEPDEVDTAEFDINAADKPPYFYDPEDPDVPDPEEPPDHVAGDADEPDDEEA